MASPKDNLFLDRKNAGFRCNVSMNNSRILVRGQTQALSALRQLISKQNWRMEYRDRIALPRERSERRGRVREAGVRVLNNLIHLML